MGLWRILFIVLSGLSGSLSALSWAAEPPSFWDPCLLPLTKYADAYRLLQTPSHLSEAMAVPGDRMLVRMAGHLTDLNPQRLTPQGLSAITRYLSRAQPEQVMSEIAQRFGTDSEVALQAHRVDGENWIRHMFDARNKSDWNEVIRTYDVELKGPWQTVVEARLQAALALNRRNARGGEDRKRAHRLVDQVIEESKGKSILSEAYGIKARIFKDTHKETKDPAYLDLAIRTYMKGFDAVPGDYYPGVAAINLMLYKNTPESIAEAERTAARVQLAVNMVLRRYAQQGQPPDFWVMSSALLLLVIQHQWESVSLMMLDLLTNSGGGQNLLTTVADYRDLEITWRQNGVSANHLARLHGIIQLFESAILNPEVLLSLSERSPSYVSSKIFPDMEGAFNTSPIYLKTALRDSEIEDDLLRTTRAGVDVMTFHKFLQSAADANANAVPIANRMLLARTGEYRNVVQVISEQTRTRPWWLAYGDVGVGLDHSNADQFFDRALAQGKDIYFLVPEHFRTRHQGTRTLAEFDAALRHLPGHEKQIHFVFGFEQVFPQDYHDRLTRGQTVPRKYTEGVVREFTWNFQRWLVQLGPQVRGFSFGTGLFDESLYPLVYDQVLRRLSFHQQLRALHSQAMPRGNVDPGGRVRRVKILDAGGGTGLVAGALVADDATRDVEIFDRSEAMTRVAKGQGLTDVHISDIQNLVRTDEKTVDSNSVDGVVCSNVIYLLSREQIVTFFKEVFRVLKSGGKFSVSSMLKTEMSVHQSFLIKAVAEAKSLEDHGQLPLGASAILSSSNQQLVQRLPLLFTFEEIAALGAEVGFLHRADKDRLTYEGAGFFVEFEKP